MVLEAILTLSFWINMSGFLFQIYVNKCTLYNMLFIPQYVSQCHNTLFVLFTSTDCRFMEQSETGTQTNWDRNTGPEDYSVLNQKSKYNKGGARRKNMVYLNRKGSGSIILSEFKLNLNWQYLCTFSASAVHGLICAWSWMLILSNVSSYYGLFHVIR